MFFAVASGACAAFNGVFAKLYVVPLIIQACRLLGCMPACTCICSFRHEYICQSNYY
jgi:hypothetical protein